MKCTDNVQKPFICVADQGSQDDAIAMCKKNCFGHRRCYHNGRDNSNWNLGKVKHFFIFNTFTWNNVHFHNIFIVVQGKIRQHNLVTILPSMIMSYGNMVWLHVFPPNCVSVLGQALWVVCAHLDPQARTKLLFWLVFGPPPRFFFGGVDFVFLLQLFWWFWFFPNISTICWMGLRLLVLKKWKKHCGIYICMYISLT